MGVYQAEAFGSEDVGPFDVAFPETSPFRLYRGQNLWPLYDLVTGAFAESDEVFLRFRDTFDVTVDVIQFEQPWLYGLGKRLKKELRICRDALLIYSSQNIEAPMKGQILESMAVGTVADEAVADIDALERKLAREADLCVAVTPDDAAVLGGFGAKRVIVARNGISPWTVDEEKMAKWRAKLPTQPWPLFIASAHPPNFNRFVDVVGDALACIPPGSRLVVAGGVGPHLADVLSRTRWGNLSLARLQVLGVLEDDDLAAVKSLASVFLLPIGAGGGSNIKTAEALYSGKPVICTGGALRGFEEYGTLPEVTVADSPAEFQAAIRTVLGRISPASPKGGCGGLRKNLTWDACLSGVPVEVASLLALRAARQ
jgi:glycosyltransferase involved in cell wall biosynthesis